MARGQKMIFFSHDNHKTIEGDMKEKDIYYKRLDKYEEKKLNEVKRQRKQRRKR